VKTILYTLLIASLFLVAPAAIPELAGGDASAAFAKDGGNGSGNENPGGVGGGDISRNAKDETAEGFNLGASLGLVKAKDDKVGAPRRAPKKPSWKPSKLR